MKTTRKKEKTFDTVKVFREIKEKIAKETEKMTAPTTARIIFIIMGLVAGLAEEIVYSGFAIKALISNKINKWLAVFMATISFIFQHGLKSIDQFMWFLSWGLIFGLLFVLLKKLNILIIPLASNIVSNDCHFASHQVI